MNHKLAIRLIGIVQEIVVVVILRRIEGCRRRYLGDDGRVPGIGVIHFSLGLLGDVPLFLIVVEMLSDTGPPWSAPCWFNGRRIMGVPENVQQFREGDNTRVEAIWTTSACPVIPGANLLISRVVGGAAGVAETTS